MKNLLLILCLVPTLVHAEVSNIYSKSTRLSTCYTLGKESVPGDEPEISEDGYYIITSVDELLWLRHAVNYNEDPGHIFNARLTTDLNISGCTPWTSIGLGSEHKYMGHFDGQGHTITGMRGDKDEPDCCGFFGYMYQAAVNNLTVMTPGMIGYNTAFYEGDTDYIGLIAGNAEQSSFTSVNAEGYVRNSKNVGGIVGYCNICDFTDCHYSSVGSDGIWGGNADRALDNYCVGGIAAYTLHSTFVNCTVKGNTKAGNWNYNGAKITTYTGGILGQGGNGTTISCCAMIGSVFSDDDGSAYSRVGGLVGNHFDSSDPLLIDRSFVYGDIECGSPYTGIIMGYTTSEYRTERCAYNSDCSTPDTATGYGTSAMNDSEPIEAFGYYDFEWGNAAAYLGAPWGHSYGIDETGYFSCPYVMLGEQFPVLGGVPFYKYWDPAICDYMTYFAGDLNQDYMWSTEDVDIAAQLISGNTTLEPSEKELLLRGVDINGDGQYTISDIATLIQRILQVQAITCQP